jgi:hypothetical protein
MRQLRAIETTWQSGDDKVNAYAGKAGIAAGSRRTPVAQDRQTPNCSLGREVDARRREVNA